MLCFTVVLQADIPTTMGVQTPDAPMETDGKDASAKPAKKYFIDSVFIHRPREGVEMKNPIRDCMSKADCVVPNLTSFIFVVKIDFGTHWLFT